jgi:hypothetical protein
MRTMIIIMAVLSAGVAGAQYSGIADFTPLVKKCSGLAEQVGLVDRPTRYVVVGLDITAGREGELQKDREGITRLVKGMKPGDILEVYLIHSRAQSEQEAVFRAALSENPGPANKQFNRARQAAEQSWEECWEKNVMSLATSDRKQQTDLFGFLLFVAEQKPEFMSHKEPVLVMLTDGQQVGDGCNMERRAPGTADLERAKDNDLVADLGNVRVVFAGMTATHQVSNAHWRKLRTFWKRYAAAAGVRSVALSSERRLDLF